MNCPDCAALLGAYSDGELDLVNALAVEEHVKSCAKCSTEVRQSKAIHLALQDTKLAFEAPQSLRRKISATAREQLRESSPRGWSLNLPSFSFGVACAAVVVLLTGTLIFSPAPKGSDELVAAHVRSLMADHLTDVVSSDSHTVKPWFTGKIDFTAPVKDFATEGFPLVGGRLDYLQNRAAIALVYKRNQHTINVFISPTENRTSAGTEMTKTRGFSIVRKRSNGLEFDAVSDLNAAELEQLVSLISQ